LASPPVRIGRPPIRYGSECSRLFIIALSQSKMTGITDIGFLGAAIIALQVGLFIVLVKSSQQVRKTIDPLRQRLKQSLSEFNDQFSDSESNIVVKARERFVQARKKIERVDTSLIVSSVLSEEQAFKFRKFRLTYVDYEHFYRSGPSILITLGLLGTFAGLTANLGELSNILDSAKTSPADSLLRVSTILEPMATAFISSLIAVALSIVLWIMGTIHGTTSMATDLGEFIGAYLDQVVQSDHRHTFYQPVENSHKDTRSFLTKFLADFKEQVGESIEKAMKDKIGEVFNSISSSASTYARYVSFIEESGSKLRDAGICFENASKTFANSSFATEFGDATDNFTGSLRLATDSSRQLILTATGLEAVLQSLQSSCDHAATYFYEMNEFAKTQNDLSTEIIELVKSSVEELSDSTKQLREARLAVGRDARANEQLVATTAQRLESVERSMKSITDTLDQLIKSSKSSQKDLADAMLTMKNDFIKSSAAVNESVGERIMRFKDSIQQMSSILEVAARENRDSSKVFESVMSQASESFQQSSAEISSTMRKLENDIDLWFAMANKNSSNIQS
jgi:hypothetical protein